MRPGDLRNAFSDVTFHPGDSVRVSRGTNGGYEGDGVVDHAEGNWVYVFGTWDENEGAEVFPFVVDRVSHLVSIVGWDAPADPSASFHLFEVLLDSTEDAHPGSKALYNHLIEAGLLHAAKQKDYGKPVDPFANVRSSEEFGIEPWVGAMVRLNDKVKRLQSFARTGKLENEGVIDSFMDIAVYALIARVLYETAA